MALSTGAPFRSASLMHLHKPACHYGSAEMHQRVNDFLIPLETKRCPAPWLRQVFGRDFTTSPREEEVARRSRKVDRCATLDFSKMSSVVFLGGGGSLVQNCLYFILIMFVKIQTY